MIRIQFSFETALERDFVRRIVDGIGCVTRLTRPIQRNGYRVIYADAEIPEHLVRAKGGVQPDLWGNTKNGAQSGEHEPGDDISSVRREPEDMGQL